MEKKLRILKLRLLALDEIFNVDTRMLKSGKSHWFRVKGQYVQNDKTISGFHFLFESNRTAEDICFSVVNLLNGFKAKQNEAVHEEY